MGLRAGQLPSPLGPHSPSSQQLLRITRPARETRQLVPGPREGYA